MVSAKGKEKVSDSDGKGKRKFGGDDDKTGGGKRKNRGVLRFFDDLAYQVDDDEYSSDDSMFDIDDLFEDEFGSDLFNNEPGKLPKVPELPSVKEEEISEEEIERMMENRYKPGAGFVTYAEDGYEHKTSVDRDVYVPSPTDPTIWKVKCMVGRERYSAFCLMQKYVDLEYLGTKLQIISAFALDHVKGFIFIEAEKQNNIYEACNGLCTIYPTRVAPVPNNEMSRLLSARSKSNAISVGMWARVKSGKYKGDLAQVVAVNDARKKVTAKLIPRIDLKAMAEKIGGGVSAKRSVIPPQRLISSSELDEFRPLINCRKDRDTNEMVEVLDGMMLKDGYLYKKIPIESLSFWGVMPTEAELLKFEPSKKDESTDVQWLSQLFGEKKKKPVETAKLDKGSGKSDGSSCSTNTGNNFELHDLVFFGRKDFGVVIGSEKDGSIKVIKEGSVVVTVKQSELKSASFDKKLFSVLDQHSKTISINDIVRVKNGQLKDRQGVVKKIYKGVLFLFDGSDDESEQENNGYICVKAQLCEKISGEPSHEKGSEPGPSGCADLFSSPQSPLSPDKSWEEKDNKSSFKRDDDAMFSVGQSLRIRMGPLKGYRCRVLAVRRSDVTVKLDSQQKILTVKSENLSEVHGRNSAISQGEESLSTKPFDFLGTQGGGSDWTSGAALSTEGTAWNAGGSKERTSWSALDPSNSSLSKEPDSVDPADDNAKKGTEESSWQTKPDSNENSSWGSTAAKKADPEAGQASGWGTSGGWNQATTSVAVNSGAASWGKAVIPDADVSAETHKNNSWDAPADKSSIGGDTSGNKSALGKSNASPEKKSGGWGNASGGTAVSSESQWGHHGDMKKDGSSIWGKGSESLSEGGASGQAKNWDTKKGGEGQTDSWNKPKPVGVDSGSSWGKQDDKSSWGKPEGTCSWNKKDVGSTDERNKEDGWKKPNVSGEDKEPGQNQEWNANKGSSESGKKWGVPKSDGENRSPGWNNSKVSNTGNASGWGSASTGNEEAGTGKGSWGKEMKQNDNNKPSWNTGTTSLDGSPKGNWASQKASEANNSGWNQNAKDGHGGGSWKDGKNAEGGSTTGWGNKSNWGKSGTGDGDGHQESIWSNKSNWKSDGGFGENNNQDGSSNDRGGGGRWRGRGGRGGDRGGFRGGRGGSDFGGNQESTWSSKSNWNSGGGFGDNNNSQDESSNDRGRGGRWSGGRGDRGRGGSDGGRFGGGRGGGDGEGGFRGRGRGDWNNNRGVGDSNTEGGWKSSGGGSSWNQTGSDNSNQHQSWNQPSEGGNWNQGSGGDNKPSQGWGSSNAQDGEWGKNKGVDSSKDLGQVNTGASGWGSTNASFPKETHGGWNKPSANKESGGGWNNKSDESVNQSKIEGPANSWGTAPGSGNSSGNWGKSEKDEGPSNTTWGKGSTTSWGGGGSGKW